MKYFGVESFDHYEILRGRTWFETDRPQTVQLNRTTIDIRPVGVTNGPSFEALKVEQPPFTPQRIKRSASPTLLGTFAKRQKAITSGPSSQYV